MLLLSMSPEGILRGSPSILIPANAHATIGLVLHPKVKDDPLLSVPNPKPSSSPHFVLPRISQRDLQMDIRRPMQSILPIYFKVQGGRLYPHRMNRDHPVVDVETVGHLLEP